MYAFAWNIFEGNSLKMIVIAYVYVDNLDICVYLHRRINYSFLYAIHDVGTRLHIAKVVVRIFHFSLLLIKFFENPCLVKQIVSVVQIVQNI